MAEFDPTPPPLELPAAPAVLSPNIPLNPPMVGEASPFIHVDGQNRDIILESIRTWIRVSLLPWTTNWQDQLTEWETDAESQLNAWMELADAYITEHAVAGLSFRTTVTDIAGTGTTAVVLDVDQTLRPITVGDLVLDQSTDGNYGIVSDIIDSTHATVSFLGSLRGPSGYSWRITATPIAGSGTTDVLLVADNVRPFALGDLVLDTGPDGNYGDITTLIDSTHVRVTFQGSLIGPSGASGLSVRYTASAIAGSGDSAVVLPVVAGFPPLVGDTVIDEDGGNGGTITVVADATHATVSFIGNFKGVPGEDGTDGTDGIISSIVAGANVSVDGTDPANPIITAHGVFRFLNFARLHQLINSDNDNVLPQDGDLGIVIPDGNTDFLAAVWVYYDSQWITPQIWLSDDNPNTWASLVGYMDLIVNTSLIMAGCIAVEPVNNSHPVWNETAQTWRLDKTQLREGALTDQTPSGSVVKNADHSYTLTNCTMVELDGIWPTLALDATDQATLKIEGVMASNGLITFRLSQAANGPDSSASYGVYGRTLNYTDAPTLGYDTDAATAGPVSTGWSLASDTTNSPTVLEATLTIKNIAASVAAIAKLHSIYRTPDFSQVYERDFTVFNVLNVGGANPFRLPSGFQLIFAEAFTGTLRVMSEF